MSDENKCSSKALFPPGSATNEGTVAFIGKVPEFPDWISSKFPKALRYPRESPEDEIVEVSLELREPKVSKSSKSSEIFSRTKES